MQGKKVFFPIIVPGTLTANITVKFVAPAALQLVHVGAVASNDSDATIIVGTSSDTDAYIEAATIGDSGTPEEFELADFVGDQYPHIADGTIVVVTVDFDGDGGTAAQNLNILLTFTEG